MDGTKLGQNCLELKNLSLNVEIGRNSCTKKNKMAGTEISGHRTRSTSITTPTTGSTRGM